MSTEKEWKPKCGSCDEPLEKGEVGLCPPCRKVADETGERGTRGPGHAFPLAGPRTPEPFNPDLDYHGVSRDDV